MKKDEKKNEGVTYASIYDEEETHSSNHVDSADFEIQSTMDSTSYVSACIFMAHLIYVCVWL
jgi:hypothetical protein